MPFLRLCETKPVGGTYKHRIGFCLKEIRNARISPTPHFAD